MKMMFRAVLLSVAALGFAACTQEAEQQDATGQPEPVEPTGSAQQMGKHIDKAVLDLKQRAKDAESRLADKLIEAGKSLKTEQQSDPGATR